MTNVQAFINSVKGTPTFFINGVRYNDAVDCETLLGVLENSKVQKAG